MIVDDSITELVCAECLAYEWISRLVREGVVSRVGEIATITGFDSDLVARVCMELYKERYIKSMFWGVEADVHFSI